MTFGNVRFLFGASLNTPSEERLLAKAAEIGASLTAEVLKVPHHGSADFSSRMLEAVKPVVSVVSSGDESSAREYIHPRAGLVGALGKALPRDGGPATGVRHRNGGLLPADETLLPELPEDQLQDRFTSARKGTRALVVTNSGKEDQKEAYAFTVDARGDVSFEDQVRPI